MRVKLMFFVIFAFYPSLAHSQVFGNIHREFCPQIAFGDGWVTHILMSNVSENPAQFTIGFGRPDGSPLPVPIVRRNGNLEMISSYNPSDIPPKSSWTLTLGVGEPNLTVGYVVLFNNMVNGKDTIKAQVTYSKYTSKGELEGQAAVFTTEPSRRSSLQALRPGTRSDVGLAIANPNLYVASVNLKVHNMAGDEVASVNLVLPAGGQVTGFVTDMAPTLKAGWRGGLIIITADQEVATMGLFTSSAEKFIFSSAGTTIN